MVWGKPGSAGVSWGSTGGQSRMSLCNVEAFPVLTLTQWRSWGHHLLQLRFDHRRGGSELSSCMIDEQLDRDLIQEREGGPGDRRLGLIVRALHWTLRFVHGYSRVRVLLNEHDHTEPGGERERGLRSVILHHSIRGWYQNFPEAARL